MTTLMQASQQWASRPADERFLDLFELRNKVGGQRNRSAGKVVSSRQIEVQPHSADPIKGVQVCGPNGVPTTPSHWAFGQLAQRAGAPAGYLRTLPAPVAADCLNYGLKFNRDIEDIGVLVTKEPERTDLRAVTGPNYGRIWNVEVVDALIDRFGDGRTGNFRVPGEFGKDVPITRENTTIYGSDRDMFVFLADEHNRIELPNRRSGKKGTLARGFFTWNSEVGSETVGGAFFLFDYVCCNRIVWGAEEFKEIRIRHTSSAPDKWLQNVAPILLEYANSSAAPVEAALKAAQNKKVDDLQAFLAKRYTKTVANQAMEAHLREEGRPAETIWDAVTGMTAYAKTFSHQDSRVALERDAGKLLDLVA